MLDIGAAAGWTLTVRGRSLGKLFKDVGKPASCSISESPPQQICQVYVVEARPRATCAVCLVQDGAAYWAHVGDSRIYLLRNCHVSERTRDHSHVELLLQEGLITEDELTDHPMRNFVECCLGGDVTLPGMTVTNQKRLNHGDTLLACTDGLWSGLADDEIARLSTADDGLTEGLRRLGEQAVRACGPYADNTSAVALRWDG